MASYKYLVVLSVILVIATVGVYATNLTQGARAYNDELACYGNVHLPAQAGLRVKATRICKAKNGQIINYIEAIDVGSLGKGGYAEITTGGLWARNVTIYLWSQVSQPLDFNINVYSKSYILNVEE